ncbi:MAG: Dna2/Cas4 domain-containing protein [Clostridium sp.]|nr:Dna2/Cas4 domain-containing protein [Clostridium sp.]
MGFREVNFGSLAKFNSAVSSQFISFYEEAVIKRIQNESVGVKNCTFAPSCMRCDRKSWFRLRGTETDFIDKPDIGLDFRAKVGTARHIEIQTTLKNALGKDWLDVGEYLKDNSMPYEYELTQNNMETLIHIKEPPVRFACDGILRFSDTLFLLEIKTADYSSWSELMNPKDVHMDQIKCYAALLNIHDVLVLYEDRQNGSLKCYQINITDEDFQAVFSKFDYVQKMVKANLAPERLPNGDYLCKNCEYKEKCKEWG